MKKKILILVFVMILVGMGFAAIISNISLNKQEFFDDVFKKNINDVVNVEQKREELIITSTEKGVTYSLLVDSYSVERIGGLSQTKEYEAKFYYIMADTTTKIIKEKAINSNQ